jgi:hypothetical protein
LLPAREMARTHTFAVTGPGSRLDDGAVEAAEFWKTWLTRSGLRTP